MLNSAGALREAFSSMWSADAPRSRTLARLVRHERQIEGWWKCEVAAHLWDHAGRFGDDVYVWLESFDRADVALAQGEFHGGRLVPTSNPTGIVIPIELKTVGTFWKGGPEKAYRDNSKKCLEKDMADAAAGRRLASPFAAVGLLVTHADCEADALFELFVGRARQLGAEHGLTALLDEPVPLPHVPGEPSRAHQLLWLDRPLAPPR